MPASKIVIVIMACLMCALAGIAQGTTCDPDGKTMTCTHTFSVLMILIFLYTIYLLVTAKCPVLPAAN